MMSRLHIGPFRAIHGSRNSPGRIETADGALVARTYGWCAEPEQAEAETLAMAAGPRMMAALERLFRDTDFDAHPEDFAEDWHEARAALAEARGEPCRPGKPAEIAERCDLCGCDRIDGLGPVDDGDSPPDTPEQIREARKAYFGRFLLETGMDAQ